MNAFFLLCICFILRKQSEPRPSLRNLIIKLETVRHFQSLPSSMKMTRMLIKKREKKQREKRKARTSLCLMPYLSNTMDGLEGIFYLKKYFKFGV